MGARVSIIVPVYQAEHTIERCVDSILRQEYEDFELILADDGSTDASPSLCDAYAARDSRVRVLHKANTGVSDTRNAAMAAAGGTYLQFVDSDDWITPDATKLLVRTAQSTGCDLVVADFYRVVGNRVSRKGGIEEERVLTREEFAAHMMEDPADFYYGVLWNKLYRRDIVKTWALRMDTGISWCEDFIFNLEYMLHAERFAALRTPIYYYVKTKGSLASQNISLSRTIRTKLRVFAYYNNFYKHVLDEREYEKKRLQVYRYLLDSAGDGAVPPSLLSGARRLGEERSAVCPQAAAGAGLMADIYRARKLLERYLEPVALQNDLSLAETWLLLHLSPENPVYSRKELADFSGMSRRALSLHLQKLSSRGLIRCESASGTRPRQLRITFLPAARLALSALSDALADYDRARFAAFTPEEIAQYAHLSGRVQENIRRILQ